MATLGLCCPKYHRYYEHSDSCRSLLSTGRSPCFTLRTFLTVPSPTTLYTPALALARLLAKLTILLVWVTRLLALGLSALVFALHSKARRCILPNRVRYPTDWSFASGCSPPHLTVTQLPSATELDVTLNRTCTDLICNTHRRTNACVSQAWSASVSRIGVGERSITGLPSLRTVRAVLPHTALQKTGISSKRPA